MTVLDIIMALLMVVSFAGLAFFFLRHINTTGRHIPYKPKKKSADKIHEDILK